MGVLMRILGGLLLSLVAGGCIIDFRDGLACASSAECDGYACVSGRCVHPGTQGGRGAALAKAALCAPCTPTGNYDECEQVATPNGTSIECVQLAGFDTSPHCRVNNASQYGDCAAFFVTSTSSLCMCPAEVAQEGQPCGDALKKVCRNGSSPSWPDICVTEGSGNVCRKKCFDTYDCPPGKTCRSLVGGSGACTP